MGAAGREGGEDDEGGKYGNECKSAHWLLGPAVLRGCCRFAARYDGGEMMQET
jgi:hypothetical protein